MINVRKWLADRATKLARAESRARQLAGQLSIACDVAERHKADLANAAHERDEFERQYEEGLRDRNSLAKRNGALADENRRLWQLLRSVSRWGGFALFDLPSNEAAREVHVADAAERLVEHVRQLREKARKWDGVSDFVGGTFNADEALLRKLACALGTSQLDEQSVKDRAAALGKVNAENAELRQRLARFDDLDWLAQKLRDRGVKVELVGVEEWDYEAPEE